MTQEFAAGDPFEKRRDQTFPTLSSSQIARLTLVGVKEAFADGALVVERGQMAVSFYVVLAGALDILSVRDTTEQRLTTHCVGEFSGELTLLMQGRSLVRTRARGPTLLLRVDGDVLRSLLLTDAELGELLVRAFILRRMGLLSKGSGDAVLVGSQDSSATHRIRSFLGGNAHPYHYLDVAQDGDVREMLAGLKVGMEDLPILIHRGTSVLRNPTDLEIAECLGIGNALGPDVVHDLVICGAGPGGLAAAVYGASEGLDVVVIEGTAPGGQAASSSKIENYLGFPTGVSGQVLASRATIQAEKFGARITIARRVEELHTNESSMRLVLAGGTSVRARAVIIATGAEYAKSGVDGLARFEGTGVYYAATAMESQYCTDEEIIVVGGGNSAGQAATFLSRTCRHVHILVRGSGLAASMSSYLIRRIGETSNITLHTGCQLVELTGRDNLESVGWRHDMSGELTRHPIRHVFLMTGARPRTEWLRGCVVMDAKGFVRTGHDLCSQDLGDARWPLERRPYLFETSRPGIFAIGDVRANSVKRVASAVGEGAICVQLVHKVLEE